LHLLLLDLHECTQLLAVVDGIDDGVGAYKSLGNQIRFVFGHILHEQGQAMCLAPYIEQMRVHLCQEPHGSTVSRCVVHEETEQSSGLTFSDVQQQLLVHADYPLRILRDTCGSDSLHSMHSLACEHRLIGY
jgi:hypothetical protein